jgi:Leucine-rich repeat (LRR) protein
MTHDKLLQLIDQAAAEGWTELDLARAGVTELPPKIGQLSNLQQPDLRSNQLSTVAWVKRSATHKNLRNRGFRKLDTTLHPCHLILTLH